MLLKVKAPESRQTPLRGQKCAHNPEAVLASQGALPHLSTNKRGLKSNISASNLLPPSRVHIPLKFGGNNLL
jgi:hypothetical protein